MAFQEANNYAVNLAESKIVMPMNNDIKLHPEALYYLTQHFDNKDTFAVSGKIFAFDQDHLFIWKQGRLLSRKDISTFMKNHQKTTARPCLPAAVPFMVNRQQYLALGGFDSMYHPLYYEEN